jgi:hypothetical protein
MSNKEKQEYTVVRGINYPPSRRAEPGDVVSDIPTISIGWLLEGGIIVAGRMSLEEATQLVAEQTEEGQE